MNSTTPPKSPNRISRRRFLKRSAAVIAVGSAAAFGYTWRVEPHWIEVVHRSLPIAKLPNGLIGKTLVQVSDLHVGPIVDEDYLISAMARISSLEADFITITGDFMTTNGVEQIPAVDRVIAHLMPAKLATVAIMGNHDYGRQWKCTDAANGLSAVLRNRGITVLRNQIVDISGLQIAGLDDVWGPNFNPVAAIKNLNPSQATLALCHNPDAVDLPVWAGFKGWILAGHTHGGQCKPPFLPPPILPVRNRRYTSGEFDLFDGRRLYINRGVGYLHRVRFNARPEITMFTLSQA